MEPFVYDELRKREKDDWWFVGRRRIILALLGRYLTGRKNLAIADIGCGAGDVIEVLDSYGKAIGLDNDKQIVEFGKKRGRNVVQGDVNKLDFPNNTFDLVLLLEVLEHLDNDMVGIKEIFRILKSRGIFLVTVPALPFLWSAHDFAAHHRRRYTKGELERKLTKVGFKIVKISYMNTFLFPVIFFIRLWKNIFKVGTGHSDFFEYSPIINQFLGKIFSFEAKFLGRFNFPFGVSLIAIIKKQ